MRRIVQVESSYNPFAIGVVGGRLERQPRNKEEAMATARWLEGEGYNFSVGLAQVNKHNFAKHGLTLATAFEPCPNLYAGGEILKDCFARANKFLRDEQAALRDAFSCYYSGNFITGYKHGYVRKLVNADRAGRTLGWVVQGTAFPKVAQPPPSVVPRPAISREKPGYAAPSASDQTAAADVIYSRSALLF